MITRGSLRRLWSRRSLSTSGNLLSKTSTYSSSSSSEISHFDALASSWWDVNGPQRILHKMNLLRMDFIYECIRKHLILNRVESNQQKGGEREGEEDEEEVYIPPYNPDILPKPIRNRIKLEQEMRRDSLLKRSKLKVLDVGCGGGILSESLARLSFIHSVKGIDLSADVLKAAEVHKNKEPWFRETGKLTYENRAIEELPVDEKYDIVTLFEMLEHVDYPSQILTEALLRVNVGGWVFLSTINRDFVSWFTTILMGEYVFRIVPIGTHSLDKYIDQREIVDWFQSDQERSQAFEVIESRGCVYLPAYGWKFTSSAHVGNYFMAIQRRN